ncbi:signal peptidase I [Nocardioides sp. zg-DK7169]|uniref:signal peptidase I n=1 Tax=Nocardioides sp. zg-DK7169 TaxID=2736600 RepID=UPI001551BD36|nr:signal peptidase I [Nocardioides sp. zg-DK7169]NPC97110.1 signal peptidase I [Nocardioides sp. zg-DK7169]
MSVLRRIGTAVALLCSLAATALAVVLVVVPVLSGSVPLTVLTGSMAPVHDPGDIVVVRPAAAEDLRVGDVITFEAVEGEPRLITHRIAALVGAGGRPAFLTRGDANPVADPEPVLAEQVRGRVWYAVPQVGRLGGALGPHRDLLLVGAGALLLGAVLLDLWIAARRRRTTPARDDDAAAPTSSATAHGTVALVP